MYFSLSFLSAFHRSFTVLDMLSVFWQYLDFDGAYHRLVHEFQRTRLDLTLAYSLDLNMYATITLYGVAFQQDLNQVSRSK